MSDARAKSIRCAEIVERSRSAIIELCRRFGVRRLDLFGSAATERFDPDRSDLDFLVEFEEPFIGGFSSPYFGLLKALQDLFQRDIDLVLERNLINPYRRRRILAEKLPLYPAP
jgi:predicted nucleotidyltransferase